MRSNRPDGHRLQQRPVPQVPVLPTERGRRGREAQRASADVGGDDVSGVSAQEQRLHAAAGAQVERAPDRRPRRGLCQRQRRRSHAEDVVPAQRPRPHVGPEVGHHPGRWAALGERSAAGPAARAPTRPMPSPDRPAHAASRSSGSSAARASASSTACPSRNIRTSIAEPGGTVASSCRCGRRGSHNPRHPGEIAAVVRRLAGRGRAGRARRRRCSRRGRRAVPAARPRAATGGLGAASAHRGVSAEIARPCTSIPTCRVPGWAHAPLAHGRTSTHHECPGQR